MNTNQSINKFSSYLKASGLSPLSQKAFLWDLSKFNKHYGQTDIHEIKFDEITEFLELYLKSKKSPASMNRMKSTLTRFFNYLQESGHIAQIPFKTLSHEKIVRKSVQPLKPIDRISLQNIAAHRRDVFLLLQLYLKLGLRLTEALKLNISDVTGANELRIIGKRSKVRYLDITKDVRVAIKEWLPIREKFEMALHAKGGIKRRKSKIDKDALFLTTRGTRMSPHYAQFLFRKCFKKCGLNNWTVHKLRHAFAKNLVDIGTDIRTVQEILGHSNIKDTQIYTTVTREDVRRALKKASDIADNF